MCLVSIPADLRIGCFTRKKTSRSHVENFFKPPFWDKICEQQKSILGVQLLLLGEKKKTKIGVLRSGRLLGSEDLMSSHFL